MGKCFCQRRRGKERSALSALDFTRADRADRGLKILEIIIVKGDHLVGPDLPLC